jgi:hypothetical protein
VTNGGSWYWNDQMPNAYSLDVDSGVIGTTNGFTPLAQSARFAVAVTGFTSANPGVVSVGTAADAARFIAGDVVKITEIAESGAGTSKNGQFTVASVSGTSITLTASTVGYKTYVSGGFISVVSRLVTNSDGSTSLVPQPTDNFAIRGITVGTTPVGANSAVMVAVCRSSEHVT